MPPQSRGNGLKPAAPIPYGLHSKSTPNLPTLRSLTAIRTGSTSNTKNAATLTPNETDGRQLPAKDDSRAEYLRDEPSLLLSGASDDENGTAEEEDGQVPNLPSRPIYRHHSRSHTYLGPSTFAPPFYNRPPTPLPPSPSLTSLLRPSFSQSRPTTPDHSSDEGTPHTRPPTGTQTPNSAAASTLTNTFRTAKTIPRASPKVPTYEYYGFTLYLTSSLAFIVYVLWAFLPSPFLHQLGIYYYPNRWWALAIPAWTVMFVVYIYVALAAYNVGHLTLPLTSIECLVDEAAQVAIVDEKGQIVRDERPSWRSVSPERGKHGASSNMNRRSGLGKGINGGQSGPQTSLSRTQSMRPELDWKTLWMEGTDAVMDIPVGGVCEILYGGDGDTDDDDEYDTLYE